jgi:hypothetical protein
MMAALLKERLRILKNPFHQRSSSDALGVDRRLKADIHRWSLAVASV